MSGLVRSRRAMPAKPPRSVWTSGAPRPAAIALRSAPAEKTGPVPAITPDPHLVVGLEAVDGRLHAAGDGAVDGVAGLGTVDGDQRDPAARLELDHAADCRRAHRPPPEPLIKRWGKLQSPPRRGGESRRARPRMAADERPPDRQGRGGHRRRARDRAGVRRPARAGRRRRRRSSTSTCAPARATSTSRPARPPSRSRALGRRALGVQADLTDEAQAHARDRAASSSTSAASTSSSTRPAARSRRTRAARRPRRRTEDVRTLFDVNFMSAFHTLPGRDPRARARRRRRDRQLLQHRRDLASSRTARTRPTRRPRPRSRTGPATSPPRSGRTASA